MQTYRSQLDIRWFSLGNRSVIGRRMLLGGDGVGRQCRRET